MKRLPFLLSDFTRIIWHSARARDTWAPRLSQINSAWTTTEREMVARGERDACLTFVQPHDLPEVSKWAVRKGLTVLPLAVQGQSAQYSATPLPVQAGRPFYYRIVLTRPMQAEAWVDAWQSSDNPQIGRLLGYPKCCREFFEKVWVEDKCVDTTWQMSANTKEINSEYQASMMLRWLGVRFVPHLPCAFDCQPTLDSAKIYAQVMQEIDSDAAQWASEMLQWPAEWTALHGIAEIRTPVLTISTRTDATSEKYTVMRNGSMYPEEGAQGLKFPFRIVTGKVTEKPAYKRAQLPIHELNGFGSQDGMDKAHATLMRLVPSQEQGLFLDLGCGNGRLLERVQARGWQVLGLELSMERAGAAHVPVKRGDLLDVDCWDGKYNIIAFMPGRLLEPEVDEEMAERVCAALQSRADLVLCYAYGDWLQKFGGLGPLISEAGLGAGDVVARASDDGVEAALLRFTTLESRRNGEFQKSLSTESSP